MTEQMQTQHQQPPVPPQPPLPPMQTVHKNSKGWLKFIVGLVVGMLIMGIAWGVSGSKEDSASTNVENNEPEQTQETQSGSVGQTIEYGNLEIKVYGYSFSNGDSFSTPEPGNQYLVVELEIKNTGSKPEDVSTMMQMKIKTPEGYAYDQAMYFPEPKYPDGRIMPGEKARGLVAFEVPIAIGSASFSFNPLIGNPVLITLQ
jgi:hypothetical protein